MRVYLQNPRSGNLFFSAPSVGRCPLEVIYSYPSTLGHIVSVYVWLWGSIFKILGVVDFFPCTFRREMPFGNEIYLSEYHGSCNFNIYIYGYGVYLQKPRSDRLFFLAPSGGRRPLEMKYTYPSTLGHVVSEYIWLLGSISKNQVLVACFFFTFRRETPLGNDIYILHIYHSVPDVIRIPTISLF